MGHRERRCTLNTYPNIEAFYNDDPRRRLSGESDYGVWWTNGPRWPTWRVSYIQATGEVYAVEGIQGGRVEVLGVVPPDEGRYYYHTLDKLLDGWAEEAGRPLSWVRERLGQKAVSGESTVFEPVTCAACGRAVTEEDFVSDLCLVAPAGLHRLTGRDLLALAMRPRLAMEGDSARGEG